jgi:hypothetical protein
MHDEVVLPPFRTLRVPDAETSAMPTLHSCRAEWTSLVADWTAMLVELWERLRGCDKWTPAVATVQSTELTRLGPVGNDKSNPPVALAWESICKIKWTDQNQVDRTGMFHAYEESPLYQLVEGNTICIRFDPANPSEFYLPGMIESGLVRTWKLTIYAVMMIALAIGFIVFLLWH